MYAGLICLINSVYVNASSAVDKSYRIVIEFDMVEGLESSVALHMTLVKLK